MNQEVKSLIATKNHILEVGKNGLSYESQIALKVIERKIQAKVIQDWIANNLEKLTDFVEIEAKGINHKDLMEENEAMKFAIKELKKYSENRKTIKVKSHPMFRLFRFIKQ